MRVLVNALSVTNLSGRHVLIGHLSKLASWTAGVHEYIVLYHSSNKDVCADLGDNVRWLECPAFTSRWWFRALWEMTRLPGLISGLAIDCLFMPSGTAAHFCDLPQISFAQNPWCLAEGVPKNPAEKIKAAIQRLEYRKAMKEAVVMVFNSEYMRDAYRRNAGLVEKRSSVVYQGIEESTFEAAARMNGAVARKPLQVVCVSVMAPHKGVETLIEALRLVRFRHGIAATLILVGDWPDRKYERTIRSRVSEAALGDAVSFLGHVSREGLYLAYAESRVFCLMSRCESFGIPAVEAQAFGTPVVSSDCCAMPEIEGEGGFYARPGDAEGAAKHLLNLLSDDALWQRTSELARRNAGKYHWDRCSRPMLEIFDFIGRAAGPDG